MFSQTKPQCHCDFLHAAKIFNIIFKNVFQTIIMLWRWAYQRPLCFLLINFDKICSQHWNAFLNPDRIRRVQHHTFYLFEDVRKHNHFWLKWTSTMCMWMPPITADELLYHQCGRQIVPPLQTLCFTVITFLFLRMLSWDGTKPEESLSSRPAFQPLQHESRLVELLISTRTHSPERSDSLKTWRTFGVFAWSTVTTSQTKQR